MKHALFLAAAAATLVACAPADPSVEHVGAARDAVTICPAKKTLKGLDVSHYDGDVDWPTVAGSGRAFAIAKATEGVTFADPKFSENWAGIKAAKMARGAYHFFHANDDPIAQAEWFEKTMGPLEPGDLPPSLDLEVDDGQSAETVTSTTIAWLDHVHQATGMKPLVYTSTRFIDESMGGDPKGLEDHAILWVARWGVDCPDVPTPFTSFAIWQTGGGTVPGETAEEADLDVFNGDESDLAEFVMQAPKSDGTGGAGGEGGSGGGHTVKPPSTDEGSGGSGGSATPHDVVKQDSGCSVAPAIGLAESALAPLAIAAALAFASRRRRR